MLRAPEILLSFPNDSFVLLWPKCLSSFGDPQSGNRDMDKGAAVSPSWEGEWEGAEKGKAKGVFWAGAWQCGLILKDPCEEPCRMPLSIAPWRNRKLRLSSDSCSRWLKTAYRCFNWYVRQHTGKAENSKTAKKLLGHKGWRWVTGPVHPG